MDRFKIVLVFMTVIVTCATFSIDRMLLGALEVNETDEVISKSMRPSWNDYTVPGMNGSYVKLQIDMIMSIEEAEDAYPTRGFRENNRKKRSAVRNKSLLWPRRIPYTIDDNFSDSEKLLILEAMQQWMQFTCLEFVRKQPNDFAHIQFQSDMYRGCATFVGMLNLPQPVFLSAGCLHRSILIHEIGHVLGLNHEHSRPDRDDYVSINYQNVEKEKAMQFDKIDESKIDNYTKAYDYTSIMHYSKDVFSKDWKAGLLTIEPKNETFLDKMGKGLTLSFPDAKIVNAMYQCSKGCVKKVCPRNGFLGKNCECYCPGPEGEEPVRLCTQQVYCGKPLIDQKLYRVYDLMNAQIDSLERDFFNGTQLIVEFLKDDLCGFDQTSFTCLNGDWKGDLPLCESDACDVPDDWNTLDDKKIEGGTVMHGTNLSISCPGRNSITLLLCNDSTFLNLETDNAIDVNSLTCENSKVHYHVIRDEGRRCQVAYNRNAKYTIKTIDGERLWDGDYVSHMSSVKASCDDPDIKKEFHKDDLETIMVCKDGAWDGFPPIKCPRAKKLCSLVAHAHISGSLPSSDNDVEPFEDRYNVQCDEGYTLNVNSPTVRCTFDGAWTPVKPKCTPNSCNIPNNNRDMLFNDAGTNVIGGMAVPHGDHANIRCAKGEVAAADRVLCHLGNWETGNDNFPVCRKVVCPVVRKVTPFIGFALRRRKEYIYGDTVGIRHCPRDLELKGQRKITCQRDGTWSGTIVCKKFCTKGKTHYKKWPGKKMTVKPLLDRKLGYNFDAEDCRNTCEQEKRFLCKTVAYGYVYGEGMKCYLYRQTIDTVSKPLENNISWEVAQRTCI